MHKISHHTATPLLVAKALFGLLLVLALFIVFRIGINTLNYLLQPLEADLRLLKVLVERQCGVEMRQRLLELLSPALFLVFSVSGCEGLLPRGVDGSVTPRS